MGLFKLAWRSASCKENITRTLLLMFILVAVFLLSSCNDNTPAPSESGLPNTPVTERPTESPSPAPTEASTPTPEVQTEEVNSDFEGLPAKIVIDEKEYTIIDIIVSKGDTSEDEDYLIRITAITNLAGFESAPPDNPNENNKSSEHFPIWSVYLSDEAQHFPYRMEFGLTEQGEVAVTYFFSSSNEPKSFVFFEDGNTSNQRVITYKNK